MSLFQCEVCGCCENTALSAQGTTGFMARFFDWDYAPERKEILTCSVCNPTHYKNGKTTMFGKWHDKFPRQFLEKGMWVTDERGDLVHKETRQKPTDADYLPEPV